MLSLLLTFSSGVVICRTRRQSLLSCRCHSTAPHGIQLPLSELALQCLVIRTALAVVVQLIVISMKGPVVPQFFLIFLSSLLPTRADGLSVITLPEPFAVRLVT